MCRSRQAHESESKWDGEMARKLCAYYMWNWIAFYTGKRFTSHFFFSCDLNAALFALFVWCVLFFRFSISFRCPPNESVCNGSISFMSITFRTLNVYSILRWSMSRSFYLFTFFASFFLFFLFVLRMFITFFSLRSFLWKRMQEKNRSFVIVCGAMFHAFGECECATVLKTNSKETVLCVETTFFAPVEFYMFCFVSNRSLYCLLHVAVCVCIYYLFIYFWFCFMELNTWTFIA